MFIKTGRIFGFERGELNESNVGLAGLRNGLVVVGVDFLLGALDSLTIDVLINRDAAFLVKGLG